MSKGLKILFLFFMGVFIFPQQSSFAQEIKHNELCQTSSIHHKEHTEETALECPLSHCQHCIFHSNVISIFYFHSEYFTFNKLIHEAKKIIPYSNLYLSKGIHSVWHPPQIS